MRDRTRSALYNYYAGSELERTAPQAPHFTFRSGLILVGRGFRDTVGVEAAVTSL